MNGDVTSITLNITEILAILALVWGLGKMSQKLDTLATSVDKVTTEVAKIADVLSAVMGRVSVLEDRDERGSRR